MNPIERAGSPDPKAEAAGEKAQRERLIEAFTLAEIPEETLKGIISKLNDGSLSDLTDEEKEIIRKVSEEVRGTLN